MDLPTTKVVTRFAPSPTGYLHVGGARTALFNWLLARHHGGRFLLRIEDTDLARSTQQACDQLLDDLRWLGLNWDNDALVFQSKRRDVYDRIINDLLSRDLAYEAWETQDELAARRQQAEREKRAFVYRRPQYTSEQVARFKSAGRVPVVRFAMPVKEYRFSDVVLGKEIVLAAEEAQDFVIRKGDGMPTYHFAVVVDDAEMGITHVLRGQEHTKNTFNHIALQDALGYPRPTYAHLTTIQNPDGSKMSKRDRDKAVRHHANLWLKNTKKSGEDLSRAAGLDPVRLGAWLKDEKSQLDIEEHAALLPVIGLTKGELPEVLVHEFRENGYLPEVLLNFLALLGWSPGGDRERMTINEMIQLFSLDRVGVANPKFSREKLIAFNTEAAASMPRDRLVPAFRNYLSANPESPLNRATDEQLARILQMKKGFRTFRDADEPARFLLLEDDQIAYEPQAVEKVLKKNDGEGLRVLRDVREVLDRVSDWTHASLELAVKEYCDSRSLGLGKVAQPIRVAVSGTTVSPPIFESLEFLGKAPTLARIDRCVRASAG